MIPDGPPMGRGHRNPARPPHESPHRLAGTSGHYRHVKHVHVAYRLPDDVLDPRAWAYTYPGIKSLAKGMGFQ